MAPDKEKFNITGQPIPGDSGQEDPVDQLTAQTQLPVDSLTDTSKYKKKVICRGHIPKERKRIRRTGIILPFPIDRIKPSS